MNVEALILELVGEVRTLRKEIMQLQQRVSEEKIACKFLNMKEACAMLHVSRTTMQKKLAEGDLPFAVKRGKSWLFPADKLRLYASGLN